MKILKYFEYMFTIAALMLCSGGPLTVILSGGFSQGDEQGAIQPEYPIIRQLFLLVYVGAILLLLPRWKAALKVLMKGFFIFPILLFACASVLWSDSPSLSQTRAIALIATSILGLYISTRYTPRQQLRVLGLTFISIAALSFFYAIVIPKYGIMGGSHVGAWRGIYTHKNILGKIMSFGSSILLLNVFLKEDNLLVKYGYRLGLAATFSLIVLSTSTAAIVNFSIMVLLLALLQIYRLNYKLIVAGLSFCSFLFIPVTFFLLSKLEDITQILGKDPTLTGRTEIWKDVLSKIQERPFLGHGYQAFWRFWDGESADIMYSQGWPVTHSHNGFLDVSLDLGVIGLALFLIGLIATISRGIMLFCRDQKIESLWPVMLILYFVVAHLTEGQMVRRNDVFWVLYSASVFTIFSTKIQTQLRNIRGISEERYRRLMYEYDLQNN